MLQITLSMLVILAGLFSPATPQAQVLPVEAETSFYNRVNEPFFGDLKEMRERRIIRVLVSYNRTNYFMSDAGTQGIEFELLKSYENYLNRGPLRERYQTHIVFIVVPFNELMDHLLSGHGDLIASGLTITPGRQARVDFSVPYIKNVTEVLVSHPRSPTVKRLEDLSGQRVIVVADSSYIVNLEMTNQALGQAGLTPIEIVKAAPILDAEDLLEMVNAEIYDFTVVDNHIARAWSSVFSNIKIHEDFILYHNGQVAWAVRKENPKLKASLNQYINRYAKPGRFLSNVLYTKYFELGAGINQRPLSQDILRQVDFLKPYFQLYANFYDLDWLLVAATAYQESRFQQDTISNKGAIGIMQVRPSTARAKSVNIPNITDIEQNIHAGTRYLAHLKEHYFSTPDYTEDESLNFTLAAYNAGPTRIRQLQRLAERQGLNPYKWFYNVEQLARTRIGQETVNYVISIQKHRVALESAQRLELEKRLARGLFP